MHFFSASLIESKPTEALVVELVRGYTIEHVLEDIYKNDAKRLGIAQLLILRAPVATPINPSVLSDFLSGALTNTPPELDFFGEGPHAPDLIFGRFPKRPVHLLYSFQYDHYISTNISSSTLGSPLDGPHPPHKTTLKEIQRKEMEIIVEDGRARFPAIPGVVYEAPNGRVVKSFLRIGNLQRSRSAIDALFFWLLPYLQDCGAIITDTWSIGSIALNTSRRLASYREPPQRPCPVEMVASYLDGTELSATEAADHIERLGNIIKGRDRSESQNTKILFLSSAISTGNLHNQICALLQERNISLDKVRFVTLFNLGRDASDVPCLVDWSKSAGFGAFAPLEQSELPDRFDTIKIDHQIYFPTSYKDVLHVVRQTELQAFRSFLDRYSDISPIRVHRNVTDDGPTRHHAVSIDTLSLFKHPAFKSGLANKLSELEPPPRVIVTPPHDAGRYLAAEAISVLARRSPHIEYVEHSDLVLGDTTVPNNTRINSLICGLDNERESVLILDDALITGRRLNHYQQALRHIQFRGRIHYLVGVARPPALSEWEYRRKMLRPRPPGSLFEAVGNTIDAVESFPIPDWNEDHCPWCAEMKCYQAFLAGAAQSGTTDALRARRQLLEQTMRTGISQNLFLTPPGGQSLSFTTGSRFAEVGTCEASVFAAVASGIQALRSPEYEERSKRPALGPRHYPVATVLDHNEYLFGTYSDSLLRACMLRSAHDYELNYTDQALEKEKTRRAIELIDSNSPIDNDVSAEIVLAALLGKFPLLELADNQMVIDRLRLAEFFGYLLKR